MQSYQEHLVSQFLKDRHPYLEEPFTSEIDPSQVTLAVFFRQIPKLAEALRFESLPDHLQKDALHTLNELVSDPSKKDTMNTNELLKLCGELLESKNEGVRKEAALLIGGLVVLMNARDLVVESQVMPVLQEHLTDSSLEVREAVAWALCRLSGSRDGVDRLVETVTVGVMVKAFIHYSKSEDTLFLMLLLEAFINLSEYDDGIEGMLGTGLTKSLIALLGNCNEDLAKRTLHVLMQIGMNHQGKQEGVAENAIASMEKFLVEEKSLETRRIAAALVMSLTINNNGKVKAVATQQGKHPKILKLLYKCLLTSEEGLRVNSKQAIHNISDLPAGFEYSVSILSKNLEILDEVFSYKAVKPLLRLLPKLNTYKEPPKLDSSKLGHHQRYLKAIHFLTSKYPEAITEAIDTVNVAQKLGPFLSDESGVGKETASTLKVICQKDTHNGEVLLAFIEKYGGEGIKRTMVKYSDLMAVISK